MIYMIYDVIINKKLYHAHQKITSTANFLLCKSCFWCASLLNIRPSDDVCPSCMNYGLKSMPVSFDYI